MKVAVAHIVGQNIDDIRRSNILHYLSGFTAVHFRRE